MTLTPYISKNLRAAYVNYMDLDVGTYTTPFLMGIGHLWTWVGHGEEKYFLGEF